MWKYYQLHWVPLKVLVGKCGLYRSCGLRGDTSLDALRPSGTQLHSHSGARE